MQGFLNPCGQKLSCESCVPPADTHLKPHTEVMMKNNVPGRTAPATAPVPTTAGAKGHLKKENLHHHTDFPQSSHSCSATHYPCQARFNGYCSKTILHISW